jgi:hypothetical protein
MKVLAAVVSELLPYSYGMLGFVVQDNDRFDIIGHIPRFHSLCKAEFDLAIKECWAVDISEYNLQYNGGNMVIGWIGKDFYNICMQLKDIPDLNIPVNAIYNSKGIIWIESPDTLYIRMESWIYKCAYKLLTSEQSKDCSSIYRKELCELINNCLPTHDVARMCFYEVEKNNPEININSWIEWMAKCEGISTEQMLDRIHKAKSNVMDDKRWGYELNNALEFLEYRNMQDTPAITVPDHPDVFVVMEQDLNREIESEQQFISLLKERISIAKEKNFMDLSLQEKILELCRARAKEVGERVEKYKFNVSENNNGTFKIINIHIQKMYSLDDFIDFKFLSRISDLLGTKNINLIDKYYTPGCNTCDYGSCDKVTIKCVLD